MKLLGYDEIINAKEAVRLLYKLRLIDLFAYEALIAKIEEQASS